LYCRSIVIWALMFLCLWRSFFSTFLKEGLFCENSKTKIDLLNYRHMNYHVILLLIAIMWSLYYFACDEGKSNVWYVLFIKATFDLCILCFVALGFKKLSVSRMKFFCYVKNSHQVHTSIINVLPSQCHVVLNDMLIQNIHMCWIFIK
jgi:hypothetical protein